MSYEKLSAVEILAIKNPYDLFKNDNADSWKTIIRIFQAKWHPDRNSDPLSTQVMAHINLLYQRIQSGDYGNVLMFTSDELNKRKFFFKYKKEVEVDIGKMYIGRKMVLFCITPDNSDLYDKAIENILSIHFPTKMMEAGFTRMVPKELKKYGKTDKGYIFTIYKGENQVRLADIISKIDPTHLPWILDGVYSFALLMNQAQSKVFGDISIESIFINPTFRTVHVLSGWWFSTQIGKPLSAFPNWIVPILPKSIVDKGVSDTRIDQYAVKALGIRLLGDETLIGSKLLTMDAKWRPLVGFLRSSPLASTLKDYSEWNKIKKDLSSTELKVSFDEVYQ